MWLPTLGLSVFGRELPDRLAALAVLGLATTMSAGRRWAKVPTSRAVPQADGWPVSENAPLPGLACFPVSRWTM